MKNKKLTRRQTRYLNILFEFNFQMIFRAEKMNSKTDVLTRMFSDDSNYSSLNNQTIFIFNRVEIRVSEIKTNLFNRVHEINKLDDLC